MQDPHQHNYLYKKYRITGLVQGVFYRQSTQLTAMELGLMGWVQNEPDGDVMVWVKGRAEKLNLLEAWLKVGPPRANVSGVEELSLTPEESTQLDALNDFSVVR